MCEITNCYTLINIIDEFVLLLVYGQSCHLQSENTIHFLPVLIIAFLHRSDKGLSSILEYYFNLKLLLSQIYHNKCNKPSKCTLPGCDEKIANLCAANHRSTVVVKKHLNDPTIALKWKFYSLDNFSTCSSLLETSYLVNTIS